MSSCNNSEMKKNNEIPINFINYKDEASKLNDILKKYEEPSQIFKVSSDKPTVIIGKKGTKISINPNDLITESGKPFGKDIKVELKELTNQEQLLRSNAQTVSNGKLLVSGGAYFIGMTSNDEQLRLKDSKILKVQFPKITDEEMVLFYGQRNDLGEMNWENSSENFKVTAPPASSRPIADTETIKWEILNPKSDIDAIFDYIDTGYVETPEEEVEGNKQRKNYIVNQKVYEAIGIRQLGWINCDRFLEIENITDLYASFNQQDSIKNANVFLVFKNINSVMQANFYSDKSSQFENIPVGYKARLIAYTIKHEKVFAYSTELTITKGQKLTLNLKEINENDFKNLIGN